MIMVIGPTKKKAEAKAEQRRSREQHDQHEQHEQHERREQREQHAADQTAPADEQPEAQAQAPQTDEATAAAE